ncbi:hypothetical protein A3H55_00605 [Candidatus Kuenenbacteria bacterium RIFCSPLOWO2_02_FULL_42_16]|uniref:Uncharacterized protein n=1 Tax=Candidatus Kuenenbacteria bacterium RIFCSPLOWO2_02_FULL_42_16 TaxID=1798564 RepID=A0A1F6FYC8_9BACT|nr:MAG: hypothetical protein A3H55_00605 [Candidatus Kuenenbacteria bacterium RIFCSPLOWO2_02_FULL_42_16]
MGGEQGNPVFKNSLIIRTFALAIQTPFREVLVKCGIIRFVLIFLVNLPKGSMKKLANAKVLKHTNQ